MLLAWVTEPPWELIVTRRAVGRDSHTFCKPLEMESDLSWKWDTIFDRFLHWLWFWRPFWGRGSLWIFSLIWYLCDQYQGVLVNIKVIKWSLTLVECGKRRLFLDGSLLIFIVFRIISGVACSREPILGGGDKYLFWLKFNDIFYFPSNVNSRLEYCILSWRCQVCRWFSKWGKKYKVFSEDIVGLFSSFSGFEIKKGLFIRWYGFGYNVDGIPHGLGLDFEHAWE